MKMYQMQPAPVHPTALESHWDVGFDPNNWVYGDPQYLYLSDYDDTLRTLVDEVDYAWAINHLWLLKKSNDRSRGPAAKQYVVTHPRGGPRPANAIFLHKEICFRAHGPPPSPSHTIADHLNGDSMINCRWNLRWATPRMNRANRFGSAFYQLKLPDLLST